MDTNTPTNTAGIERLQKAEREYLDATYERDTFLPPAISAAIDELRTLPRGSEAAHGVMKRIEEHVGGIEKLAEFMMDSIKIDSRYKGARKSYIEIRGALVEAGVI